MEYPKGFNVSKRAPSKEEMEWLEKWIHAREFSNEMKVLEFGCGITSWVIFNSFRKVSKYVCVENYERCMNEVRKHIPNVEFVDKTWYDIPKSPYDFVFVDASTCFPKDLKSIYGDGERVFRDDAIHYVMDFVSDDCYFVIHDWCYKGGWLRPREYFETRRYELVDSLKTIHGIGIYQKSKHKKEST